MNIIDKHAKDPPIGLPVVHGLYYLNIEHYCLYTHHYFMSILYTLSRNARLYCLYADLYCLVLPCFIANTLAHW